MVYTFDAEVVFCQLVRSSHLTIIAMMKYYYNNNNNTKYFYKNEK